MASMGTFEFTVHVDPSRVVVVLEAMAVMERLLNGYGHIWTDEERAKIKAADDSLTRDALRVEPA